MKKKRIHSEPTHQPAFNPTFSVRFGGLPELSAVYYFADFGNLSNGE